MTDFDRYAPEDPSSPEKGFRFGQLVMNGTGSDTEPDIHHHLHRGLKSRQVAMIAIGGAIGEWCSSLSISLSPPALCVSGRANANSQAQERG